MKHKKIVLLVAHSVAGSLNLALAEHYAETAQAAGHRVKILWLDQLTFDPILHQGYRQKQPLEPDLLAAQQTIQWADHLVFVFPVWWGSVPAVLKGFLDRVFLPGFAFRYQQGKVFPVQLLKGRTAQLLVTTDTPPWFFRWFYRAPAIHQMKKTTLELCGVRPVKVLLMGPVLNSTDKQRQKWLQRVAAFAKRA